MKRLLYFAFLFLTFSGFGQVLQQSDTDNGLRTPNPNRNNSNNQTVVDKRKRPPITDYKIISIENDTTYVDTTLSIYKDYKWNYIRKDDFELLPFSNIGQPYNELGYDFSETYIAPRFGARAKHVNHYEVEDISYYNVATPFTELYFKTVIEQGQNLDALFTSNTSPQFNFFAAYKGLRSLGNYQASLSSVGNLRLGFSYNTKNKRYYIRTHFAAQDYTNDENGGLTAEATQQYIDEIDEFDDRSILEVNFQDAESTLDSRRFYLNQKYFLFKKQDSVTDTSLSVGHILNFKDKEYGYTQASARTDIFGEAFETSNLNDLTEFQDVYNEGRLTLKNRALGSVSIKAGYTDFNYGYNRTLNTEDGFVTNRLTGNIVQLGGEYSKVYGNLLLKANVMTSISGDRTGNYINGIIGYQLNEDISLRLSISSNERSPNYNFLLYQSDYINYNWQNDFENERVSFGQIAVSSGKYGELKVSNSSIKNYTYFERLSDTLTSPSQFDGSVSYLKVHYSHRLNFGLFGVANNLQYQNTSSGAEVFKVPDFIVRSSVYYQDYWFKKALYLQTGFTAKYFSEFQANGYDPILSEFYVQNKFDLEGFPTIDFFFNAKIRQARVFFKLENASTIFLGNNNFTAETYPYRDFVVRFGLVWDFFL